MVVVVIVIIVGLAVCFIRRRRRNLAFIAQGLSPATEVAGPAIISIDHFANLMPSFIA